MDPNGSPETVPRLLAPLCERCRSLGATPDRFQVCPDTDSPAIPAAVRYSVSKARRGNCPLCVLILQAMQSCGNKSLKADKITEFSVQWDVDRPHVEDGAAVASNLQRLKVFWTRKETVASHGRQKDEMVLSNIGELLLVNVARAQHTLGNYMRAWLRSGNRTEERDVKGEIYLVSADTVPRQAGIQHYGDSKALILKWLHTCHTRHDDGHPLCRGDWKRRFRSLVDSTSFGVIDVVDKRLCSLPLENNEPARFVALSYNVSLRTETGGLSEVWDRFPRTIRDALKLVEDIGGKIHGGDGKSRPIRYVWIDLLCIVQDRPRSWKFNARNMDLIYGNAAFTICAADGANSNAGLLALHDSDKDNPRRAWITPEWNHRAWTFQERILSQRCVIFAGGRLYFQCCQTSWSQDDNPSEVANGMESAWRVLLHRAYRDLEQRPIRFFMTSVEKYTGRNLSFAQDILSAFDGVSRLMEWYLCADIFFGLPTSHFDLALLWKPLAGKSRRILASTRGYGRDELEFPSWSWCGWMDAEDPGKGAGVTYDGDFLGGCLDDIRDWLLNHTWIIWYVRNWEGDLRPLWERPTVPPSNRTNLIPQCRGYKSRRRPGCGWVNDLDVDENTALDGKVDDYGRPLRDRWFQDLARGQTAFSKRFPDHPFGVRGPDLEESGNHMFFHNRSGGWSSDHHHSFYKLRPDHRPYQPILQFWTLQCEFPVVRDDNSLARHHLQRFRIMDTSANRCGSVVMDKKWADERIKDGERCTFVALSEAKCITEEEKDSWAEYPGSAEEGSEWCCFYVMALTMDVKRGVSERVGLGKVFQLAFQRSDCTWSEIILG
ncbi:hypothetical protein QBC47DRAFT_415530 [Echria macrotheca]|uniref:Heterokaryon incompatibility domain-containing protein n=1 Tax=Echria macrotheca TaxID=438768 RepID=A0AAJ0FA26_9PEZI|nr:hypothetical protein QBC47DRAFT_415530 [Echria macrotheca]